MIFKFFTTTQKSQRKISVTFVFYLYTTLQLSSLSTQAQITDSTIIKIAPHFSGQVVIAKNDSIVFSFCSGWANYPMQIPMKKEMVLEICELSSIFTKDVVYQLIEGNQLNIDSAVSKYIPKFPYSNITIKNLLENSSGLPSNYLKLYHRYIYDDESIKLKNKAKNITNTDIVEILEKYKPNLEFNPGEKKSLCNTNDIVLAYLLELMYFKPYEEIINANLLSSGFKITANNDLEYAPLILRASGHKKINDTVFTIEESLRDLGFKYSDATMGQHHIYANAESIAKYFTIKHKGNTKSFVLYTGNEPGYNSLVTFNNELTVVILSNTSDETDSSLILKKILKLLQ